MASKTHLADSEVPLKEGEDLVANCMEEVKNAVFAISADEELTNCNIQGAIRHMVGLCSRCRKLPITHRYIYGIRSGEENLHDGSTIDRAVEQVEQAEKRSQQ